MTTLGIPTYVPALKVNLSEIRAIQPCRMSSKTDMKTKIERGGGRDRLTARVRGKEEGGREVEGGIKY